MFATENSTSGGSSDTELNELAVMPISPASGCEAVTMVTPVANRPSAPRNIMGSIAALAGTEPSVIVDAAA